MLICFECGNFVSFYGNEKGEGDIGIGLADTLYDEALKNAGVGTSR